MSDKVKITIRALEARAKRHSLAKNNEILRKCRPDSRGYGDLGDYYFVDTYSNTIANRGLDLWAFIDWCTEEGVLKPFEEAMVD